MVDNVEKIVNTVYDVAEDECETELYSVVPVSSSELNIVRSVVRLRKSRVFKAVTYEKDGDDEGSYLIKVTYMNKKGGSKFNNNKRRK